MNIQFTAKTFTSAAALIADHAAVRRRLFNPPKPKPVIAPPVSVVVKRQTSRDDLQQHDAHVMAYRRWQMVSANGPCSAHILERCEQEGMPYGLVTGPCRQKHIARFRQKLMWEIKTMIKPSASLPEIGRLFGGRDHTTVLHGVRQHAKRISHEPQA
ncbi:helix-turn-helix domain-containing protein [Shinella zoogloeoides]|uniref:helix-turn-helix domain-containing protein n=1 Tax=Shinella zoogloeoides TaxID=352475 RepID=UPI000E651EA8|nr:helix-turn-helix domain-containing protein [Shinella zoogloeoides]